VLYRLVKRAHKELEGGEWKPSVDAFLGGSAHRISVYRAALCANDPSSLPAKEPGYVCRFIAGQVRAIDSIKRDNPETGGTDEYEVCVKATPEEGNHRAHADIYVRSPAPPSQSARRKVFGLLKEALADLAQWEPGYSPADVEGE
jgi:hypothetical protein